MPGNVNAASKLPWYTLAIAFAIVTGFGWLAYDLIAFSQKMNEADVFRWDKMTTVFNAVQTMAAAAVGTLLGTTVQQSRVDAARAEQAAADARATANERDAHKARAARELIDNLKPPGSGDTTASIDVVAAVLR